VTTVLAQPRLRWWEGVGSPGIGGYVLADLAAVAVLALSLPLTGDLPDDLGTYLGGVTLVGIFGFIYSIPLALVGIPIVHFCCLRVRSQALHVLAAGLVGVGAAVVPLAVWSGELVLLPALYLGLATAVGRAAVIPLALARRPS
jgi:hypothetical protein